MVVEMIYYMKITKDHQGPSLESCYNRMTQQKHMNSENVNNQQTI